MQRHVGAGLNISNRLRKHYVFPSAAFLQFPDTGGYTEYYQTTNQSQSDLTASSWSIENASFGTVYAAVPTFLGHLSPNRVDIQIPDQTDWPSSLWSKLDARDSVHVNGPAISSLGIARYLCKGLQHWADSIGNFADIYADLAFGSTIRLLRLTEDPIELEFSLQPNQTLKEKGIFLSAKYLQSLWSLEDSDMPPTVTYKDLRRKKQISGDAILVSLSDNLTSSIQGVDMVFKSSKNRPAKIYHEIKNLLTMGPLKTVIGRPKYLVTLPDSQAVCGFLLPYLAGGDLSTVLTERRLAGTLTMQQQLSWALDLTSSLIHIKDSPAKFYSDLRMDQVVISPNSDGSETAVLLDFEQSRNIYNWAPPEVYYLEWIAELGTEEYSRSDGLSKDVVNKYREIMKRYLQSKGLSLPLTVMPQSYDNSEHGWYWPWIVSSASEQEAGMVYMLGKALWCIFEGIGDADIVLGRSSINDGQPRFPEFQRTPPPIQELIIDCTAGAREWQDGHINIYRREGKVFPLGKTGLHGEPEGTPEETKEAIRLFWSNEMGKAEEFAEARMRYDPSDASQNNASEADVKKLHYLKRPTLEEVMVMLKRAYLSRL